VTADGRWAARLAGNTPAGGIGVPLLVTQGEADTIVLPDVSREHVRGRCVRGERVEYRTYPGATHPTLPAVAGASMLDWVAERFAGDPVPAGCVGVGPGARR
jgi:alpha-beta hydrolase superfamily lysophospholipase